MYGYGYGYNAFANTLGTGLVLGFIAFVAAIVVTVLLYRKFISTDNIHKVPGVKHDWGPFFRFEHLIIENILKVLYIFAACLIAFECAASIITSLLSIMYDPGAAFAGIIVMLIVCVVLEVINRLWFEFSLLTVLIWKNTSAIRKSVSGSDGISSDQYNAPVNPNPSSQGNFVSGSHPNNGMSAHSYRYAAPQNPASAPTDSTRVASSGSFSAQQTAPVASSAATNQAPSAPQPASAPAQNDSTSNNTPWTCPSCGAFNKTGAFCAQCGSRRNDNA